MLTTIKGIYENGEIKLEEKPDVKEPMQVIVTFMEEVKENGKKPLRRAGFGKGTITYISPDFDEPLDDLKEYM